mgnify:FL=1
MKEIKLTIDGKEVQLTDKQLRVLGIERRENPFGRTSNLCGEYFYTDAFGCVGVGSEEYSDVWRQLWNAANYFNDKAFAKRVALRQLLDRKLLKYAYDNGYEATEESNQYYVNYCPSTKSYTVQIDCGFRAFCTHFSSYKATERAIEEIVKPFVKEHPEFVW